MIEFGNKALFSKFDFIFVKFIFFCKFNNSTLAINKSLSYVNYTLQADSDALDPDTLMEDRRN